MITAKDLRIGNKIYSADNDNILTVEEIRYTTVRVSYIRLDTKQPHVSISHFEDFNPIPLTPEILEQCGFDDGLYELFANTHLQLDEDNGYSVFIRQDDTNTGGNFNFVLLKRSLKYLHDLQNLFYSLTGEELQLKKLIA